MKCKVDGKSLFSQASVAEHCCIYRNEKCIVTRSNSSVQTKKKVGVKGATATLHQKEHGGEYPNKTGSLNCSK